MSIYYTSAPYCVWHGWYGMTCCPSCPLPAPEPQAVALDPVPTLMRIADALERIAASLAALSVPPPEETPHA